MKHCPVFGGCPDCVEGVGHWNGVGFEETVESFRMRKTLAYQIQAFGRACQELHSTILAYVSPVVDWLEGKLQGGKR